ncbi:unnamed protein product [Anisakis simplex]|uniref:Uncharacterized protein n=1 Tax=Anisakis simplex TaxID=6269 RepID=A0A0M3KBP1_ANISI|nr:unnamed protein product [Anisakis simplex]
MNQIKSPLTSDERKRIYSTQMNEESEHFLRDNTEDGGNERNEESMNLRSNEMDQNLWKGDDEEMNASQKRRIAKRESFVCYKNKQKDGFGHKFNKTIALIPGMKCSCGFSLPLEQFRRLSSTDLYYRIGDRYRIARWNVEAMWLLTDVSYNKRYDAIQLSFIDAARNNQNVTCRCDSVDRRMWGHSAEFELFEYG